MNQVLILYGLRLLGAVTLLLFLAAIAWMLYQDLRLSAAAMQERSLGNLRVIASDNVNLEIDTLFPLMPVTSIGRTPSNTIVIDDGFVSSRHVLITLRDRQWWLEDLGSRNGTLLNDVPLTTAVVISGGDVIVLGGTQLKIEPQLAS